MELQVWLACILVTLMISVHSMVFILQRYKRAAPGPMGLPLIGNAIYFMGALRNNPHRALARLADTYGPIVSFRPGRSTFVVVSSPALAREALVEKDSSLAARFVPDALQGLTHSSGSLLFLPTSDPLWKQNRITVSTHLSTSRGLENTRPIRERHARKLAQHFRAACPGGEAAVQLGEAVFSTALNTLSNTLFSKDTVDLQHQLEGAKTLKVLMAAIVGNSSKPNISDAFPFLAPLDLFASRGRMSKDLSKLYSFFDTEFIEPRLASGENHGDMLDTVLERHAKSQLTRSDMHKLFTDIFIGGTGTTSITVEWAMAQLLRHPDKMAKLKAEIASTLGPKEFVEECDLHKLPYLHAVVKETIRLHPAAPLTPPRRVVAEDGVSLGGYPVPIGSYVLVNLWAIGRDATAWPSPDDFTPERFMGAQASSLHFRGSDFAYRPFGAGRRVCPGLDMAARFVPLLLASILHKIDWALPDGMAPKDVDLRDHYAAVLELATPLRAVPLSSTA